MPQTEHFEEVHGYLPFPTDCHVRIRLHLSTASSSSNTVEERGLEKQRGGVLRQREEALGQTSSLLVKTLDREGATAVDTSTETKSP